MNSYLLSLEQLSNRFLEAAARHFAYPYWFILSVGHQHLYYLGADHVFIPEHMQFRGTDFLWRQFLDRTEGHTRLALIEGRLHLVEEDRRAAVADAEAAIRNFGESGYVAHLAHRAGVSWHCPEPSEERELGHLSQRFGRDATAYHYFARQVRQWQRVTSGETFDAYLSRYLARFAGAAGWSGYDFSLDHMRALHDAAHDHPFDPEACQCFDLDLDPGSSPVSLASLDFRDTQVVQEIIRLWQSGASLFVMYGAAHAFRQEAALRRLLPHDEFETAWNGTN
ncbi:MAG: hypothetical protein HY689_01955 [Chloroflexi bacterium]|nr:hypothetical protein [Chloroflexota bacterium]